MTDIHSRLMHQSLGRPLSTEERALADALEAAFRAGHQDFEDVARALEQAGVKRPSGVREPWTAAGLEQELAKINASLDAAAWRIWRSRRGEYQLNFRPDGHLASVSGEDEVTSAMIYRARK